MSRIQGSVELLAETLQGKNQDYTGGRGEFYNFEKAAEFVGMNVDSIILAEIAKKFTRLESLFRLYEFGQLPNNESMADTLLDLAGYAVIAHAHLGHERDNDMIHTYENWNPAG